VSLASSAASVAVGWLIGGVALVCVGIALLVFRDAVCDWQMGIERRTRGDAVDEDRRAYLMALKVIAPGVVAIVVGVAMAYSSTL
jgi:hypothetical protein